VNGAPSTSKRLSFNQKQDARNAQRAARLRDGQRPARPSMIALPQPVRLCRDALGPFGPVVVGVMSDASPAVLAEWVPLAAAA
jgi:hypothetical protein